MKTDNKTQRLFIAFDIPEEIRKDFEDALKVSKCKAPEGRVVKRDNLHLTVRFLGDVGLELKEKVTDVISSVKHVGEETFTVAFSHFTFFRKGSDATLVGQFRASSDLLSYADTLNKELDKLGFKAEKRSWRPHVTLARGVDSEKFDLDCLPEISNTSFKVNELSLFLSEFTPDGMRYTKLKTIYL